jgi:hypothetical protein
MKEKTASVPQCRAEEHFNPLPVIIAKWKCCGQRENRFLPFTYFSSLIYIYGLSDFLLGRRQAASHEVLVLASGGSNPSAPAILSHKI